MDKYYVSSGQLRVVLLAESPEFAAMDAMERFGNYVDENDNQCARVLHSKYIWVDDQGFREFSARWKLSIETLIEEINQEKSEGDTDA